MSKHVVPFAALLAVCACNGPSVVTSGPNSNTNPPPTTTPATVTTPDSVKVNMKGFTYDATKHQLSVAISSLDSTGTVTTDNYVTYARETSLDVPGYEAYKVQEDSLDRLFVALAATSADGSVSAVTAGDGGQFTKYFAGGLYKRDGDFTPPTIGTGPGAGQVSYAGNYAALTNLRVTPGSATDVTLPVAAGTDPSVIPRQPARVAGNVFLNANFQDNSVNGSIYNRRLQDTTAYGPSGQLLEDVYLLPSDIADDGTFAGSTARPDQTTSGDYAGVFGGANANSVAGLVHLNSGQVYYINGTGTPVAITNSQEHGVFVLTQCGANNTTGLCTQVSP